MKVICINDGVINGSSSPVPGRLKRGAIYNGTLVSQKDNEFRWIIEGHAGAIYYYDRFKCIQLPSNIRVL